MAVKFNLFSDMMHTAEQRKQVTSGNSKGLSLIELFAGNLVLFLIH